MVAVLVTRHHTIARTTGNPSSHIDMHTNAGGALHNCVTLTFDLLISGVLLSCHALQVIKVSN